MSAPTTESNGKRRPPEVLLVEQAFKNAGYRKVEAYRYNSASIRVRVIDSRFKEKSASQRLRMAEEVLRTLPEEIQTDIIFLALLGPGEKEGSTMNEEYEHPAPPLS